VTHVDDLYEPGDDREPVEPDEYEQQPVDLEEVEQRLERLKFLAPPFGMAATRAELNGTEDLHDLAALIGQEAHGLIAELREARERIAKWEALPTREEWAATRDRDASPRFAEGDVWYGDSADDAATVAKRHGMHMWRQRLSVHPWEPISSRAPF
jgi:hypothetical protein